MRTNVSNGNIPFFIIPVAILLCSPDASAQKAPTLTDTASLAYNQISRSLGLYVYPSKGQSQQKQKQDEIQCYQWAMQQSGIDPANMPQVQAAPVESHTGSKMVKGAATGAAAGAAIGAIAGDWGEGAAIGAIGGAIAGRRRGKREKEQETKQAQTGATAQQQAIKESYLKAFSVCIEGKGYTVK